MRKSERKTANRGKEDTENRRENGRKREEKTQGLGFLKLPRRFRCTNPVAIHGSFAFKFPRQL